MADDARTVLQGEDLATWASFATMLEWLPSALDAPLQQGFGVTHFEYGILFALADADGRSLRMRVLAGYANSTLSRLSRAVGRLEARSLITRSADPADGRSTLATLTDEGLRLFELATPVHEENVRRLVLDTTTPAQRRQLRAISLRVMRAVSGSSAWPSPR